MTQTTHIRTFSGEPIWYQEPTRTIIRKKDIYKGLKNKRYSNQIDVSILQHSMICALLAKHYKFTDMEIAYCAVHDFHESYVNDLPKGLKECLPEYCKIEALWEEHVHKSLNFEWPIKQNLQEVIKFVDLRALCVEMWYHNWGGWDKAKSVARATGGEPTESELAISSFVFNKHTNKSIRNYLFDLIEKIS